MQRTASNVITEAQGRVRSPILDEIRHKMLSARTAHDFLGLAHGQRIQTSALFRDDGTGGLCRVWSYIVLHYRAAHGKTAEERAAHAIGLKTGEQAPPGATSPTAD